jgi:RNA polymerase sigma-70 factor (ECF subfamily)
MRLFETSTAVRDLLLQIRQGQPGAMDRLFAHCLERLKVLSHSLFRCRRDLHHFEESDDLLQRSLIRLHRAVNHLQPESTRAFMALALQNVRWELADLAREMHRRQQTFCAAPLADEVPEPRTCAGEPESLLEWGHFHDVVGRLPEEEREVFDAVYYGGATQQEVAGMLGVSDRTVKRRWRSAKILLGQALQGEWPGL